MATKTTKTKKIDGTSTKAQILEAYNQALEKNKELEKLKVDPYADQKKAEEDRVEKSAAEFIESGFVSDTVVQKYNDLKADLAKKEADLKNLFGIEAKGASIAAMISAYNTTKAQLDVQKDEDAAARIEERNKLIDQINADIKEARENAAAIKKELDEQNKTYNKDLATARAREKEEFDYNLKRTRSKENDEWNDEKEAREKEMSEKETDLANRISAVEVREAKMAELEQKVDSIPTLVEEAEKKGKEEGKAEADKSHAFEKRALEKSAEYEKNLLQAKIDSLTESIEELKTKNADLAKKLDDAYTRNQELATTVAKNSGSTTYVTQADSSDVNGKRK